ncbi:AAA family ATPase [Bacteriovoracaceae bacterium]|nr:AAA family ATPase [Bacteriovoracaceae bacterium]
MRKVIVLVGLMGAGKTILGKAIGEKFEIDFIDSDVLVEQKSNLSISEIFANKGEAEFRKIESDVILNCFKDRTKSFVLSLGGGAFIQEVVRNIVNREAFSIYIKVSNQNLFKRLRSARDSRPLLSNVDNDDELLNKINLLLAQREEYYALADMTIDVEENEEVENTLTKLVNKISRGQLEWLKR